MRTYTYIPGRALPVAIDLGRQEKRIPPISRDAALLPAGGGRGIWLFLRRAPGPPRYGRRPLAPRRTVPEGAGAAANRRSTAAHAAGGRQATTLPL